MDFNAVKTLAGNRVSMRFNDGHAVIALLLAVTQDPDGSRHLVYDAVEWTNEAGTYGGGPGTGYYANADTLVSIEPAGDPRAGAA